MTSLSHPQDAELAEIAGKLTKAQRIEMGFYEPSPNLSGGGKWSNPNNRAVAASLYRLGILDRMQQEQRPLHERPSRWWMYAFSKFGLSLRDYLQRNPK